MSSTEAPPPSTTLRLRVTYAEVDRMGLLHHSNHLRWLERGREEYCRRRDIGYRDLEDRGTLVVVVDAALQYKSGLRLDEEADLTVTLSLLRHASLAFAYSLRRVSDGALCLTATTRHALVTREGRVTRVTPELAALLQSPERFRRLGELG